MFPMYQYWKLCFEDQLPLNYSTWAQISPCWSTNGEKWRSCCFLEFLYQPWKTSFIQQTVLAAILWKTVLVHFLFLRHLVVLLRPLFVKYALHVCHCVNKWVEIANLFPLNDWILCFGCSYEGRLFVLIVGSEF